MIAYVRGELVWIGSGGIVVDNNGIGYDIRVPLSVMSELPATGSEVKIYTYTYVREDALQLYGFLSRDDLNMFQMLIQVNGIGPRGALGILSVMSADTLRFAILAEDAKSISKAPGIGAKTASKLILELKDKMKLDEVFEQKLSNTMTENTDNSSHTGVQNDAVQALVALGYSASDSLRAVKKIDLTEDMTVEDVLKQSLRKI